MRTFGRPGEDGLSATWLLRAQSRNILRRGMMRRRMVQRLVLRRLVLRRGMGWELLLELEPLGGCSIGAKRVQSAKPVLS